MEHTVTIPRLGRLELQVLEHLWQVDETDVQQAHVAVGAPRGITLNTVGSALERLHRKKLVSRAKVSHAYRYRPSLDRDTFMAKSMVAAVGGLRSLSEQGLLAAFVDVLADSREDTLDELERLVRLKREQRR